MTYPNLNNHPDFLKLKTRDDEIKQIKINSEKHDYDNNWNSLKIDNDFFEEKYKSFNKKNLFLILMKS